MLLLKINEVFHNSPVQVASARISQQTKYSDVCKPIHEEFLRFVFLLDCLSDSKNAKSWLVKVWRQTWNHGTALKEAVALCRLMLANITTSLPHAACISFIFKISNLLKRQDVIYIYIYIWMFIFITHVFPNKACIDYASSYPDPIHIEPLMTQCWNSCISLLPHKIEPPAALSTKTLSTKGLVGQPTHELIVW